MRLITGLSLFVGSAGVAAAHTLPGGTGLTGEMAHQFLSLHHSPMMLLILVAAAILCRKGLEALRR